MKIKPKISLVGSGAIGGTIAHLALQKNLGNIELIDIAEGIPEGKALDLLQSSMHFHCNCAGSSDFTRIIDSDVVIVTAGLARKPGMTREDLLTKNASIISSIGENISKYAPNAFVIVITNPLDAMVSVMLDATKFHKSKVVGMAGILDSSRFRLFLSQELKISSTQIHTLVLGGHGDTMVPLTRHSNVCGISLEELVRMDWMSRSTLDKIIQRTRDGGAEIVKLLKTGSAFYAPATSAIEMLEAYIFDQRKILPCSVLAKGEYGVQDDICVGLPILISGKGAEKIIRLELNDKEKTDLNISIEKTRSLITETKKLF